MLSFPPTLILRHRKENLKKCSLKGLEKRSDCLFHTYPKDALPSLSGYFLLTPGAQCLSYEDAALGILLIDGTWRYATTMIRHLNLPQNFIKRSIPTNISTAYPRRQEEAGGLASVEALYFAYLITRRDPTGLLENYHWKDSFLEINQTVIDFFKELT